MNTLPITDELRAICRTIYTDLAANTLVESDDEYQSTHFCGGWTPDGDNGPGFYFSYYAPDGGDYLFHMTPDQASSITQGDCPTISLEYWKKSPLGPYKVG